MMAIFNLPLLRWRRVVSLSELFGRYYVHFIYIYILYSTQRLLLKKKKCFSVINENTIARWKYDFMVLKRGAKHLIVSQVTKRDSGACDGDCKGNLTKLILWTLRGKQVFRLRFRLFLEHIGLKFYFILLKTKKGKSHLYVSFSPLFEYLPTFPRPSKHRLHCNTVRNRL